MGGWKDNAHILSRKEVCKTMKMLAPHVWENLMNALFGEQLMCPFLAVSKEKWFPLISSMWRLEPTDDRVVILKGWILNHL